MTKNKQLDLIAGVKNLNTGFINECIIGLNSEIGWRGYSVLVNYQSLVTILFPLAPLQLFFSINIHMKQITPCQCRRYGGAKGAVPSGGLRGDDGGCIPPPA